MDKWTNGCDLQVCEKLELLYKNSVKLNKIINKLPGPHLAFVHNEVEVVGKRFEFFVHNIVEYIWVLFGNPDHAQYLCSIPEHHYTNVDKIERIYHDMHTGKWWWSTQVRNHVLCRLWLMTVTECADQVELEKQKPGATIIPIILSSDKIQLMLFWNKMAYPVYLTIRHLLKSIHHKPSKSRQGQILLACLPTIHLTHITNKSARCQTLANLFHACLGHVVEPLWDAGINGINIVSGDGMCHRGHPILTAYVRDYPEWCMITGAYSEDCPHNELGDHPCCTPLCDLNAVLDALEQIRTIRITFLFCSVLWT